MTPDSSAPATPGRPLALGCTVILAAVGLVVFIVVLGVVFLDSGANSGTLTLEDVRAYAPGTAERIADHNVWVVRLEDGSFLALDDLDAANRASKGQRCRVALIPVTDPSLPGLLEQYGPRFSAGAAGARLIFREDCGHALYDVTGARLDGPGRNLDRYKTGENSQGHLTVDMGHRECTQRDGTDAFAPAACT